MTLACKDDNSKLVEVVTVANVDAEKRVDDNLMQIWKLKFGHKGNFCSDFELKVPGSVNISKLKFRRDFKAEVWSVFFCCCLVEVMRLNLGRDSEARCSPDLKFNLSHDADVWLMY